jgi:hypothetical protein
MQLLSQKYNQSVNEYFLYKGSSLVSTSSFLPIDFSRNFEKETSVFLKKLDDIKRLESLYIFKNPEEIKRFLLAHDYLIDYLFEGYDQIRRIFGENTEVYSEHYKDTEENFEGLFLTIKTNLSPDQSLNLLEKIDEEWWLKVDFKIRSVITIMVNPV